ncbi:hypothetical protein DL768_002843 [Monosporascus sp. mg162]|nr:hypothetical protein DL768_002843 [Monosporascus sp. mg162]
MEAGEPILYSLYVYAPNIGAPIFFAIARYKAFELIGLYPVCGVLLAVGYAMREYGAYNYMYSVATDLPLIMFVLSQVFIYIVPPLLELANYHVLSRIFYYVPYCSPLAPGRVLVTFGGLMILVEVLNSLGVALSVNPSSSAEQQTLGGHLTIAVIAMQLGIIISFFCLATLFHRRCAEANIHAKAVKMTLITLNLTPLLRYEVFFYIFEASLILINSVLWNVWHPGRFLPKHKHIYMAQDGTEVEGEPDSDDRPLLAQAGRWLTFGILFRKENRT